MEAYQLVILGLAVFTSSVIKNGAAVGSGIFLLPVLALAFPPKLALGLGAPVMFASDILGLCYYWREWGDLRLILRMVVAGALGIALGGVCLTFIPAPVFKTGIGIFAISSALWRLSAPYRSKSKAAVPAALPAPSRHDYLNSIFYGVLGGIATILAHAGGVVWSVYLVGKLEKRTFVSSLIILFSLSNLIKIGAYIQMDLLTVSATLTVLGFFPLVYAGSALGNWLNRRVNPRHFRTAVLLLILCTGASLLVR